MEEIERQPGPDNASAGRSGASQKPTLLNLDQDALNRVFAKLEPEALALAGLHGHSMPLPERQGLAVVLASSLETFCLLSACVKLR